MADAMTGGALVDRVKRGAALLDEKRPGWAREIALDRLAMNSCFNCVLGQVYGSYFAGLDALQVAVGYGSEGGFDRDPDEPYRQTHAALADLWRDEIRARTTEATPCST
jgi:hypothetical protein